MNAVRNAHAERELHEVIAQLAENTSSACRGGVAPSLVVQVSAKVNGVIDDLRVAIKSMQRRLANVQAQLQGTTLDNEKLRSMLRETKAKAKYEKKVQKNSIFGDIMTNPALEALRTCGNLPRKIPPTAVGGDSTSKKGAMPSQEEECTNASDGDEVKKKTFASSYERKKEELFDRLEREWLPETTESVAERRKYNTQDRLEQQGISESTAALREKLVNKGIIRSEDMDSKHEESNTNTNGNADSERIDGDDECVDVDAESNDGARNSNSEDGGIDEPWLWKPPPPSEEPAPPPAPPTFGDVQRSSRKRRRASQLESQPEEELPCERCRRVKRKRMEEEADRKGKSVNEKVWKRWISRPGNCLDFVHADEPVVNRHREFDLDFSDAETQSPPGSQSQTRIRSDL